MGNSQTQKQTKAGWETHLKRSHASRGSHGRRADVVGGHNGVGTDELGTGKLGSTGLG